MKNMFIDSHCHLAFPELIDKLPYIIDNMHKHNVSHALCVSVDIETFSSVLNIVNTYNNIYASVGLHPCYNVSSEPNLIDLIELAKHPKVIAIGETGLDYYSRNGKVSDENIKLQRKRFRKHIRCAIFVKKPLIIHMRNSYNDIFNILKEENANNVGGVFHCFTESWNIAKKILNENFYISISGIVTFKNANHVREVSKNIPLNRLLIETDSPFLSPHPYRGKLNEPANVSIIGEYIALQRNLDKLVIAEFTRFNFLKLFNISEN